MTKKSVVFVFGTLYCILAGILNSSVNGENTYVWKRSRLCRKYPDATPPFKFDTETGRCYQIGQRGPCPPLMRFLQIDDDHGACDCDVSLRCGRPLIYWPSRKRCYRAYDQGPCRDKKWIVFGANLQPICKKNLCWDLEQKQASFDSRYWFTMNNTCYRTHTQGYCLNANEILFNMRTHYRPTCQELADCGKADVPLIAQCLPGQRLDVLGQCKRKFIALRNTTKSLHIPVTQKPNHVHCLFCEGNFMDHILRRKYRPHHFKPYTL